MAQRPVYFDYQATTPLDPRVLDAMTPYLGERFGNPHAGDNALGWEAEEAVEQARTHIAAAIGASPKEIIFTSGATESNNMAIKGLAAFYGLRKRRIVTVATEHKCVLESVHTLTAQGYETLVLPVKPDGLIDMDQLAEAVDENTLLVSVMAVNNEIGVIQPMVDIGRLCRDRGAFLHSDCAQALGRLDLNVEDIPLHLMSLSAHKIYGPKGIGALYIRRRPRVRVQPLLSGGGQERGLRSGTLSPALCVGFGQAALLATTEREAETARLTLLRDRLMDQLRQAYPDIVINGSMEQRVAANLNLRFPTLRGDMLLQNMVGFCLSTGSACSSATVDPSYVLKALGLDDSQSQSSLRISLGRQTNERDIDLLAAALAAAGHKLLGTNKGPSHGN